MFAQVNMLINARSEYYTGTYKNTVTLAIFAQVNNETYTDLLAVSSMNQQGRQLVMSLFGNV